ncbi:general secretion pathway protein GspK [Candidatus Desantisbacteria bacterium]|nr:general secretion pathway protein GspK [Candidatus Desantisbacteria bacterium]
MNDENGVALILTLIVTAILAVIILEFAQNVRVELEIAKNYQDKLETYAIARSGIEFAKYALKADDPEIDDLSEDWAKDYSKIISAVMFKNGNLKLNIIDESSKINVNAVVLHSGTAQEKVYNTAVDNLKRLCEINNQDYKFVDALIDWIDKDDQVTIFENQKESGGAENSDYKSMAPPYICKNAPLDTIRELFLLKGFTEETYFGTNENKKNEEDSLVMRVGLKDFITIYGSHQINLNTAPAEIIMALDLDLNKDIAESVINKRKEKPFNSKEELKSVTGMTNEILGRISKSIAFKSAGFFYIHSIGTINNISTEIYAVLRRDSKVQISVVYWQEI